MNIRRYLEQGWLWLSASLFMGLFMSLNAIDRVFKYDFLIQDDARQHVVWLERYLDSSLFHGDLIADYFQSVAPFGYSWMYQAIAFLGISPIWVSKLVPVPIYLLSIFFCYRLTLSFFRIPIVGFFSASILMYTLMFKSDISSGTPRAFLNIFLLGFLYYLGRHSKIGSWISLIFLGFYYPQAMLVASGTGVLSLVRFNGLKLKISDNKELIKLVLGVILITLVFSGYFLLFKDSEFGPVVTKIQAIQDAAYLDGGRSGFFSDNFFQFWLFGGRSGMLPGGFDFFQPRILFLGFLLPILCAFPKYFPAVKNIDKKVGILLKLLTASISLYVLAHLFLFKFHLPSRYTQHSIRIILAISSGITLYVLADAIREYLAQTQVNFLRLFSSFIYLFFVGLILIYPVYLKQAWGSFPNTGYVVGRYPELYRFFQEQPSDTLIASLSKEAANIPAFSLRSVFVAPEFGIAYHRGYYEQFYGRVKDLMEAMFSENRQSLIKFIEQYEIDFFLIEEDTFLAGSFAENNAWSSDYDDIVEPIKNKRGLESKSALASLTHTCTVLKTKDMLVLDAKCLIKQASY